MMFYPICVYFANQKILALYKNGLAVVICIGALFVTFFNGFFIELEQSDRPNPMLLRIYRNSKERSNLPINQQMTFYF
jgi:hypothetical protein